MASQKLSELNLVTTTDDQSLFYLADATTDEGGNVTGYTSKIGDIEEMTQNALHILSEDNLETFKQNALEHAKQFDIEKILPMYEEFYREVSEAVLSAAQQ